MHSNAGNCYPDIAGTETAREGPLCPARMCTDAVTTLRR